MYCSHCGARVGGNFCSGCGHRLTTVPNQEPEIKDWSDLLDYEKLLRIPEVRDRISRAAIEAEKHLTGEEFLELCDKSLQPITGVPLTTVAKIVQPIYAKLGVKTGKLRSYLFPRPPGKILVEVLCSLASRGPKLNNVLPTLDGCVLKATIPSDIWSFEGELLVTLRRQPIGTLVEGCTVIKGQFFDWGKSTRLDQLFTKLSQVA